MGKIDRYLLEVEELEEKVFDLFQGKKDFVLMSALTIVGAKMIIRQKMDHPTLDIEHILDTADEQLRLAVYGILEKLSEQQN